jgi:hypothetical protein
MDVTSLVEGIEASWFRRETVGQVVAPEECPHVFRMDLVFKNAQLMGEFLSRASLQILSNEELHFLNKEYHEGPSIIEDPNVQ